MISALKHIIVFSNITATQKRNFVKFFRNFSEAKLYFKTHVSKMKCLQKSEMDP